MVQEPGDVLIEQLILTTKVDQIDLFSFTVELNIYEDIFNNFMRGDLLISDSLNIIEKFNIIGEESLSITLKTPDFPVKIQKTFRVTQITDRKIVRDDNTQMFIINFVSPELIKDLSSPIFKSLEGTPSQIASSVYNSYLKIDKDLQIITSATNAIRFISPGFTPFKCINWMASKTVPSSGKYDVLFFESNKNFYFASIFKLLESKSLGFIGEYSSAVPNLSQSSKNLDKNFFVTESIDMVNITDQISSINNGQNANRLITIDVFNKEYSSTDFVSKNPADVNRIKNPSTNIGFYPINPKLNNFSNISTYMPGIYGNRKSSLLELTNIRLNINVPGRTDVEVGKVLKFIFPKLGKKDHASEKNEDAQYTGFYIISAIRHKINITQSVQHRMLMELIKL